MRNSKTQAGFSLVELLISLVLTVMAVMAAMSVMIKFARSAAASTEVSAMEEARASTETLLRADFDGAGRNLTRPSPPLAGTFFGTPSNSNYYTASSGTITKTGASGWNESAAIGRGIGGGLGAFSFTPPANGGSASVWGPNGEYLSIAIGWGNPSIGVWMNVSDPTGEIAATCCRPANEIIGPHLGGDSYIFKVESQTTTRVLKIYRVRNNVTSILWTSTRAVPSYPLALGLSVYTQGERFSNVKLTGAPLVELYNNTTDFAPLPFDGGTQLTKPITISADGATSYVLSGDGTTDASASLSAFTASSTTVDVRTPQRGSYSSGDVVLLVDYGTQDPAAPRNSASIVCRVTGVTVSGDTTTLTLERSRQANPAWSRLWSADTDHARTYPTGETTVVKLKAAVSYSVTSDARLVRIEGARASTVTFNTRSLAITPNSAGTLQSFNLRLMLAAEGVETDNQSSTETRGTIEFTSTPRALNLASNQQN